MTIEQRISKHEIKDKDGFVELWMGKLGAAALIKPGTRPLLFDDYVNGAKRAPEGWLFVSTIRMKWSDRKFCYIKPSNELVDVMRYCGLSERDYMSGYRCVMLTPQILGANPDKNRILVHLQYSDIGGGVSLLMAQRSELAELLGLEL